MVNLTDRIDILIRILFGLAIALGCYFVVRPFLTAITIAAIVTVVSWPLFLRFKNSLGNRPTPAAFFMVMLLVVCLIIPTMFLSAAVAQQLIDGTIHDADQAKLLVEKFQEDLKENDSIDIRRKLADAYMIMEDYDAAIAELEKVVKTLGTMDPLLDKSIEEAVVARYNKQIRQIRENPDAGEAAKQQIADLEAQRDAYRMQRALERAQNYPNDAQLNFELAELLFANGKVNDAIAYFQVARRSPQRRLACMVYLGRCFAANKQYDMAVEQLEGALSEMDRMDKTKLETLYYLATTLEESGNEEAAIEKYKEIYQNQANFLDVADRIQQYYNRQKQG